MLALPCDDLLLTLIVQARKLQLPAASFSPPFAGRGPHLYRPLFLRVVCYVRLRSFSFAQFMVVSYEVTNTSDSPLKKKNISKELSLAGLASFFLGFGTLFLLLWTGVYV